MEYGFGKPFMGGNFAFLSWEAVSGPKHRGGSLDLREAASDFEMPDRVYALYPEEIRQKMWLLSVLE